MLSTETIDSAPTSGQPIGSIELLMGTAVAVAADGSERVVVVGDALYEGEVVKVDGQSTVEVRLTDNSLQRLSADGMPAAKIMLAQNDIASATVATDATPDVAALTEAVQKAVNENRSVIELLEQVPNDAVTAVLEELPVDVAKQVVEGLPVDVALQAIDGLPFELAIQLTEGLPANVAIQAIEGLPPTAAGELSDGHSFVVIPLELPLLTPEAGFETQGLGFSFPEGIPGGGLPVLTASEIVPVAVLPSFSINDVTVTEGDPFVTEIGNESSNFSFASVSDEGSSPEAPEPVTITFTVTRTGTEQELSAPSTVTYTVVPGSAEEGGRLQSGDYTEDDPLTGTLDFAAGQTTQTITLNVTADFNPEPTETFTVVLSDPIDATITKPVGVGTILDNDRPPPEPSLEITKSNTLFIDADESGGVSVGDTIRYSYSLQNAGTVNLTNVMVDDDQLGTVTLTSGLSDLDGDTVADDLAAGSTAEGIADYVVDADDLGTDIVNIATASSDQAPDVTDTNTVPVPAVSITKSNTLFIDADESGGVSVGDTIRYSYSLQNAGTVNLTNVMVDDDQLGTVTLTSGLSDLDGDTVADDLAAGSTAEGIADYVVDADDLGTDIVNIATASSDQAPDVTDTNTVPVPAVSITKSNTLFIDADESGGVSVGDTIRYSYSLQNAGTVNLTNVMVDDDQLGTVTLTSGLSDLDGDTVADDLAAGSTAEGIADYVVDADDLGTDIVNIATASSDQAPDVTDTNTVPVPAVSITKSNTLFIDADESGGVSVGDTIRYSYSLQNAGTVNLTNVMVDDDQLGTVTLTSGLSDLDGDTAADDLAAGSTAEGIADYVVDADDLGTDIVNIATASSDQAPDVTDTNTVPVPAVSITKSNTLFIDADESGGVSVGDTIRYSYSLQNAGTVNLTNVMVDDDQLGTVTLTSGLSDLDGDTIADDLAAGSTAEGIADYVVDADDLGTDIVNIATASSDQAPDVTDTNTVPVPALPPTISINDVSVCEGDPDTPDLIGRDAIITFTVMRDGDTSANSTVQYQVTPGTAVEGDFNPRAASGDYNDSLALLSGTLMFTAGQTTKTITLDITDDATDIGDRNGTSDDLVETFTVVLSSPSNAALVLAAGGNSSAQAGVGTASIGDNDRAEDDPPIDCIFDDTQLFTVSAGASTIPLISGFDPSQGDILNLSDLVTDSAVTADPLGFLRVTESGSDLNVELDADGPGTGDLQVVAVLLNLGAGAGPVNVLVADHDPLVAVSVA